jgi:hypothetical protein
MLVKAGWSLRDLHAAIPLLHHLGVGNKTVKRNVDAGPMMLLEEGIQGPNETADGIVGVQIAVEKAIEV